MVSQAFFLFEGGGGGGGESWCWAVDLLVPIMLSISVVVKFQSLTYLSRSFTLNPVNENVFHLDNGVRFFILQCCCVWRMCDTNK